MKSKTVERLMNETPEHIKQQVSDYADRIMKVGAEAEKAWEGCDGCNDSDKAMWINGYIRGVFRINQIKKEQIIDAIFFGMQKGLNVNKVPETDNDWVNNYYNETFGGNNE
ncbi:hypothetical protein UFOVP450_102 [uncultured Caudovirales phage]|uniref:Uncharacterized protein n=1 Tax=uncultured Caudovirales phage TaxID=2100421 RepID=A0A6J5ME05_9CAUD|nr:hypothetical protein UFOVP450_102 [uncultured Caudovirales phage]